MTEPTPPGRTADDSMTEKEKKDMVDQIEEFEGPDRREDRGDNEPPDPQDPGVASSRASSGRTRFGGRAG